ncbi:hypothetical protein B1L79_16520 [Salmonella enterica subsp. enterica serovar Dublin]|uniref:Uncharacterized protein n=1 Tax=Salmonella dublin TaxID=98360 RepID=A0A3T3IE05_SALDU|nr:hypothetical protein BWD35_14965 [Salmonella enterica subsp. enterica serovar Dublin str. ATCC 39184]AYB07849.1 hypothetical protein D5G00_18190 [Salmonella enterica subsp. enterica serovar Dublin]EAA3203574.1 hypothetical protein [Salmonella enterica subsp. enterica serovar Hadar]EAA8969114.1 hypothetical protein [Salmonella enterica]ECT1299926.1 hypothetical protein [Salmonella enterica subsp. enterica serovar Thompson]
MIFPSIRITYLFLIVIILHIRLLMLQNISVSGLPRRFSLCLMLRGVTDDIVHTRREEILLITYAI